MNETDPIRILRRSPGRLRLHARALHEGGAELAHVAATEGVLGARVSPRTGNVLLEFDESLIDEPSVLALITAGPAHQRRVQRPRRPNRQTEGEARDGWLRAERAETIRARPAACIDALSDFERYPEWQAYVTAVTILRRDGRGRGVRVATRAQVGEREIQFTTSYRFPSPNRIVFDQVDGELEAVHGSWAFRSLGRGRTRATYVIEVKPGRLLNLLLRGPMYEQFRDVVLEHFMSEVRVRVEG